MDLDCFLWVENIFGDVFLRSATFFFNKNKTWYTRAAEFKHVNKFQVVAETRSSEAFVALCLLTVAGTSLLTQKLGFSDTVRIIYKCTAEIPVTLIVDLLF